MLVNYAAVRKTIFDMKDMAQFLIASEWNMRNLSSSIGDGGPITMFAAIGSGWSMVNLEDTVRLSTDKWKPHLLDLLSHSVVQGTVTHDDLIDQYNNNGGPFNLTTLAGQQISIDYDAARNKVVFEGGDIILENIKGIDG